MTYLNLLFGLMLALASPVWASDKIVQDILQDVNYYRQQQGLNPLVLRAALSQEAARHSQNMAAHHVPFGHEGFMQRVKHLYAHTKHPNGAAENVAYRYRDGHDVVKNWLTSPHHLANIRGHYQETGIGVARDKAGRLYFTQLFLAVR